MHEGYYQFDSGKFENSDVVSTFLSEVPRKHSRIFSGISETSDTPDDTPDCKPMIFLRDLGKTAAIPVTDMVQTDFDILKMNSYEDLEEAFFDIPNSADSGELPVVLFEGFDTNYMNHKLGWLSYFLSPVQAAHSSMVCVLSLFLSQDKKTALSRRKKRQKCFTMAEEPDFIGLLRKYVESAKECEDYRNLDEVSR